jgi:hypothetical protein
VCELARGRRLGPGQNARDSNSPTASRPAPRASFAGRASRIGASTLPLSRLSSATCAGRGLARRTHPPLSFSRVPIISAAPAAWCDSTAILAPSASRAQVPLATHGEASAHRSCALCTVGCRWRLSASSRASASSVAMSAGQPYAAATAASRSRCALTSHVGFSL